MKRREFITLLGCAVAWPIVVSAQPVRMRRIAVVIGVGGDAEGQARAAAFRETLRTLGWIEDRNVRFDVRFTDGLADRASEYASELLGLMPDLVLANTLVVVEAFLTRTRTVPIVFAQVVDPVGGGLVQSLAKPGGNVTGFTSFDYSMSGKWLEVLKEIAPAVTRVALLRTLGGQSGPFGAIQAVAPYLRVEITPVDLRDAASLERGLDSFARDPGGGMVVPATPLATVHLNLIVSLAAKYRLPAVYPYRYFVAGGGLMSYGIDNLDLFRRAASYADRILKGENPADLPVQAPTKFELAINSKTAKALGLTVPLALLTRADEVIE